MANFPPLVLSAGQLQQLQSADALAALAFAGYPVPTGSAGKPTATVVAGALAYDSINQVVWLSKGGGTWRWLAGSYIKAATDGATVTFDMDDGPLQSVTLGGNRTLALSNVIAGQRFTLILKQDGTGSRTVTWFAGVSWPGGTVPTLTTAANKSDVLTFLALTTTTFLGALAIPNA
jgi:hypothetical protein